MTYRPFGEKAVLIEWPEIIDANQLNEIIQFESLVCAQLSTYILETVIAYNSITLYLKEEEIQKVIGLLKEIDLIGNRKVNFEPKTWNVPVCYDLTFGIDLNEMSEQLELSIDQIIQIHSHIEYTVYFIGFLPGFLYLGDLNPKIHFPRKKVPRLKINKGDVAIGGRQTGIYPKSCPAGWNIIGNTPITLFDSHLDKPCFAQSSDKIRFNPISMEEHQYLASLIDAEKYQLSHD